MVRLSDETNRWLEAQAAARGFADVEQLVRASVDALDRVERLRAQEKAELDRILGSIPPDELVRLIEEGERSLRDEPTLTEGELDAHMDELERQVLARKRPA